MKNKSRIYKLICTTLALALVLSACIFAPSFGSSYQKQFELDELNEEIARRQAEIQQNNNTISELSAKKIALEERLYETSDRIDELTDEINETKEEIVKTLELLEQKEEDIKTQDEELSSRLRAMYKNGNAGILSVVLNSKDIRDLLTNLEMAKRIYAQDQELLAQLKDEYQDIYDTKVYLTTLKESLVNAQQEQVEYRTILENDKAEIEETSAKIEADTAEMELQEEALLTKANALLEEIKRLQSEEAYVGGIWAWPCDAVKLTSLYGFRYIFGEYSFHYGIDIGAKYGDSVYAACDGKVLMSGYDYEMGNYIYVDHGGGVLSAYCHLSRRLVNAGDKVTRNQLIGYVGSTGLATGAHLHFSLIVDGAYLDPLDTSSPYCVVPGRTYRD